MEEKIRLKIKAFLDEQEKTGTHAGGSGHLSNISVSLQSLDIETTQAAKSHSYIVSILYSRGVETEFTYYPDNPPMVEEYSQVIYLDENLEITGFTKKSLERSNVDIDLILDDDDYQDDT